MSGHHWFLLAIFRKIYPQAKHSHSATFIAIYSHSHYAFTDTEISTALRDMNMTRKRASTIAFQAFTPINLKCHYISGIQAGIAYVPQKDLLDADEIGIVISDVCASYGHAVKKCQVRELGNYGRGQFKITLIMAIEAGDTKLEVDKLG